MHCRAPSRWSSGIRRDPDVMMFDGPPELRDVGLVHQSDVTQIALFLDNTDGKYEKRAFVLPKSLEEKVGG